MTAEPAASARPVRRWRERAAIFIVFFAASFALNAGFFGLAWEAPAIAIGVGAAVVLLAEPGMQRRVTSVWGTAVFLGIIALLAQLLVPSQDFANLGVVIGSLCIAYGLLAMTGFWRRWLFWRSPPDEGIAKVVVEVTLSLLILTQFFAILEAFVVSQWAEEPENMSFLRLEGFFVWHFVDGIPGFKITETLGLKEPPVVLSGVETGVPVLLYKVLVIAPIIGLVAAAIKHRKAKAEK